MVALSGIAGGLVAHGNNLDEVGIAFAILVGVGLLVALAWAGGRRDRREHESDDEAEQ